MHKLILGIIVSGLICASCSGENGQPKGSDQAVNTTAAEPVAKQTAREETYEPTDPNEFSFALEDVYYESEIARENGELVAIPVGGELGRLLCNDQELALAKNSFEDGFIVTRDFGKIKFRPSRSLSGAGFQILMTPSQKEKLKAFLSTKTATDNS